MFFKFEEYKTFRICKAWELGESAKYILELFLAYTTILEIVHESILDLFSILAHIYTAEIEKKLVLFWICKAGMFLTQLLLYYLQFLLH